MPISPVETAIILAPHGRDAALASKMLVEAGVKVMVASDLPALVSGISDETEFVLIAEEALREADQRPLADMLKAQPEWSDLPFILMTERGGGLERNPRAARHLEILGNVTFLERPFHPTTLVSLARAALRARRRQFEARQRLETIREGEQRLRIALAGGGLGAWSLTVPGNILSTEPNCRRHYGRGADEDLSFDDFYNTIHPDDREARDAAARASVESGIDYHTQYRVKWPDGSEHWIEVRGRPLRDRWGRIRSMTGVTLDITDRKAAETAQARFTEELERRVEERTRERSEALAQLHEAQKLETLGQLTGGVAHDFNNLLTPIIGGLDLLRRVHPDARSQRLIGGALSASERARVLVNRLLAFARRQNLELRAVDLGALVDGMLDLIRRSIGPQILVEASIAPDLPAARADPGQLELALLNLAINARDAGSSKLTIVVDQAADDGAVPGRFLRLAVTDDGAGMDAQTLRRSIEPFYSTKGLGKGTGLGLSMVHGLAAQSGGALQLDSEPGRGTTAALLLPVAAHKAAAVEDPVDHALPVMRALAVLLVDDEALVRAGTAEILIELGHRVIEAESGEEALERLEDDDFDLIVTDYLMPGMTGVQLADTVARRTSALPVLLITGFADLSETDARRLPRLPKPFRPAELAAAIAGVVNDGRGATH